MPDARPSPGHLCGQLYATLRALRAVGAARWKLEALRPYDKVRASPSKFLPDLLDEAGRLLLKAHGRGNKYGAAAEELFRSIPDLLPPRGRLPGYLDGRQRTAFDEGYAQQMTKCTDAHGELLR
ncbi:hypothetical protein ABZ208_01185 [Streptomyces sp. NPDC006208]|uniref:hypothetical protein n=1 Tax=Streptomyces sp. NPDC006208 TaxID=3156734 RepID=UPI0033A36862